MSYRATEVEVVRVATDSAGSVGVARAAGERGAKRARLVAHGSPLGDRGSCADLARKKRAARCYLVSKRATSWSLSLRCRRDLVHWQKSVTDCSAVNSSLSFMGLPLDKMTSRETTSRNGIVSSILRKRQ